MLWSAFSLRNNLKHLERFKESNYIRHECLLHLVKRYILGICVWQTLTNITIFFQTLTLNWIVRAQWTKTSFYGWISAIIHTVDKPYTVHYVFHVITSEANLKRYDNFQLQSLIKEKYFLSLSMSYTIGLCVIGKFSSYSSLRSSPTEKWAARLRTEGRARPFESKRTQNWRNKE